MPLTRRPGRSWRYFLRQVWINSLLIVGSTLITAIVTEFIVRWLYPQDIYTPTTSYTFQNDPETDYIFKPNLRYPYDQQPLKVLIYSNSLGLPDEEIPATKAADEVRILILGDSFTWGGYTGDIANGFPNLLHKKLAVEQGLTGQKIRVINAGIPGYGTKQEVALYLKIAPLVKPDIVILGFYMGNDFLDNLGWTDHKVRREYLVNKNSPLLLTELRVELYKHSQLYRMLAFENPVTSRWQPYLKAIPLTFFQVDWENFDLALNKTETYLDQLIQATQATDIPLMVILIPSSLQIDADSLEERRTQFGLDPSTTDVEKSNRAMADLLKHKRLIWLDLLPPFREKTKVQGSLYLPYDEHTSLQGNDVIADEIKKVLLTNPRLSAELFN